MSQRAFQELGVIPNRELSTRVIELVSKTFHVDCNCLSNHFFQ